jgi:hypothetical protein
MQLAFYLSNQAVEGEGISDTAPKTGTMLQRGDVNSEFVVNVLKSGKIKFGSVEQPKTIANSAWTLATSSNPVAF